MVVVAGDARKVSLRPRVALVAQSLAGLGGTERVVSSLSELLSEYFDVYELSFDARGAKRFFDSPATFVPLGASLKLPLPLRLVSYILDAIRLWHAKRRLGIELTISNLWRADLLSVLSMGADKKISICHINVVGNFRNRLLIKLRMFVAFVYRRFDRVVTVSKPLADEMFSLWFLDKSKLAVIHNCVALRAQPVRDAHRRIRIVWCGRFVEEKNILTFVQIFSDSLKDNAALQLVMIGDGPLRADTVRLVKRLGLATAEDFGDEEADVIFTGVLSDPVVTIARCDVQVLPSIAEGFGLVLIEGFTVGVPALASDCSGGGVFDAMGGSGIYRAGRVDAELTDCGFLLPVPNMGLPGTMKTWRQHLARIAEDATLRTQLSSGAKERSHLFSPEAIRPRWLQLIEEVL